MAIDWEFNLGFDRIRENVNARIPAAVAKGLEHVQGVSAPLVPVENGHLVGSADVQVHGDHGTLTYAGPYALYQHEGVYYRHGKTGAPLRHNHGESFFLQRPMIQERDRVIQIVADELLAAFR